MDDLQQPIKKNILKIIFVAKEKIDLNPLFFHVDAGWNTDQAVGNIEKLVDGLNSDLYTEVVNWE